MINWIKQKNRISYGIAREDGLSWDSCYITRSHLLKPRSNCFIKSVTLAWWELINFFLKFWLLIHIEWKRDWMICRSSNCFIFFIFFLNFPFLLNFFSSFSFFLFFFNFHFSLKKVKIKKKEIKEKGKVK